MIICMQNSVITLPWHSLPQIFLENNTLFSSSIIRILKLGVTFHQSICRDGRIQWTYAIFRPVWVCYSDDLLMFLCSWGN